MRLGLYLNLFRSPGNAADLAAAVEQARLAEQAGFSWVVLGERHLHPPGYHEVLTSLTWIAAHTSRIGLATAGIIAPFYNPVWLAETLAHIDMLSGGRLTAGFVLGYRPEELGVFGVAPQQRVPRFEETVATVARLWTGDTTTFHGTEAFVAPRPVQRPRPRLWNGGRVSAALRRTAWMCDGWTASFNEKISDLEKRIEEYRSYPSGPDTLGQEVIVCREGFCAPTSQQARDILEPPLHDLYAHYTSWKRTSVDAARYRAPWHGKDGIAARAVIGSPSECGETLAAYQQMGANGVVLRVQPPGLPQRDALACIERLGELTG